MPRRQMKPGQVVEHEHAARKQRHNQRREQGGAADPDQDGDAHGSSRGFPERQDQLAAKDVAGRFVSIAAPVRSPRAVPFRV